MTDTPVYEFTVIEKQRFEALQQELINLRTTLKSKEIVIASRDAEINRSAGQALQLLDEINDIAMQVLAAWDSKTIVYVDPSQGVRVLIDELKHRRAFSCTWTLDTGDDNTYTCSFCAGAWVFDEDPSESDYCYCPGCGAKIERFDRKAYSWEEDPDD